MLLFAYYIILVAIDITAYSLAISSTTNIEAAVKREFACEWFPRPHDPNFKCPKDYLAANLADGLSVVTFILLGLFPCLNLLYAVNFTEIKSKCRACYKRFSSSSGESRSRATSTSAAKEESPFSLRKRLYTFNDKRSNSSKGIDIPSKEQNGSRNMTNSKSKVQNGVSSSSNGSVPDLPTQIKLQNSKLLLISTKEQNGSVDISEI